MIEIHTRQRPEHKLRNQFDYDVRTIMSVKSDHCIQKSAAV